MARELEYKQLIYADDPAGEIVLERALKAYFPYIQKAYIPSAEYMKYLNENLKGTRWEHVSDQVYSLTLKLINDVNS